MSDPLETTKAILRHLQPGVEVNFSPDAVEALRAVARELEALRRYAKEKNEWDLDRNGR